MLPSLCCIIIIRSVSKRLCCTLQCIAKDHHLNNVLLRKVVKAYGTGKLIEGVYKEGQKCLVVEDVMVSGQGIYEACQVGEL